MQASSSLPQTPLRVGSFLLEQTRIACNRGRYEVAVDLPSNQRLMGSGRSQQEAFIDFCTQVSNLLFPEATADRQGRQSSAAEDFDALSALLARRDDTNPRVAIRTKARQKTVGVTCKASLVDRIDKDEASATFASAARDLLERGLDALDQRLDKESSKTVFDDFQCSYAELPESATKQWMLRLERRPYERALVLANEYERSLSNLAAICIAYALKR
ncbi:MAG: hypothetical protein WAU56_18255 [Steroidobacteraceae bacterium]